MRHYPQSAWAVDPPAVDGRPGEGLRVAVAGAAHWHLPRHAENLAAAGVTFFGVSDPDPAVAARWAEELGCASYPDVHALLDSSPHLVLALGRVGDMAAQAGALVAAGVGIIAEKPLGLNPGQVAPVAAEAAARGTWASVALVQRYDPLWRVLDRLRDDGTLGRVAHLHLRAINGPPQRYADWGSGWMLDPATAGGGALLNLGIHGADFFRHLVQEPVQVAGGAVTRRAHDLPIEDFGAMILQSASGVLGTIEAGYTYPDAAAGMTRSGESETRVGGSGVYLVARGADVTKVTAAGEEVLAGARAGERYREWMFDSLARFRAGRPPAAGIADCLEALQLIADAYARAGVEQQTR
jgi:predicted dehydrogenase